MLQHPTARRKAFEVTIYNKHVRAAIKNNQSHDIFQNYIKKLVNFCEENNISILRTVGVIFSDDEKRTTQYVK